MLKEAYKSIEGLAITNDGAGYYFKGSGWRAYIMNKQIPKKELAAIIEIAGILPEAGEMLTYNKEGASQLALDDYYDDLKEHRDLKKLDDTKAQVYSMMSWRRIFTLGGRVYPAHEGMVEALDPEQTLPSETALSGPYLSRDGMIWETSDMRLLVSFAQLDDEAMEKAERLCNVAD